MSAEQHKNTQLASKLPVTDIQKIKHIAGLAEDKHKVTLAKAIQEQDTHSLFCFMVYHLETEHGTTSANTVVTYKRNLNKFLDYAFNIKGINLLKMTHKQAANYKTHLAEAYKPRTVNQHLSTIRQFFDMLSFNDLVDHNLFIAIKGQSKGTKAVSTIKHYSQADVSKLLQYAEGELNTILLLGCLAGLRVSEILNLKWSDIDFNNAKLTVTEAKSGEPRTVNLSPQLHQHLKSLTPVKGKVLHHYKNRVTVFRHIEKLCDALGVVFHGVHGLRHSAGMFLLEASEGNLQSVQKHLGHSSLQMAQNYATLNAKEVKADVDNMPEL